MGFPSKERIRKILPKLEKAEGTLALPANPNALEKFRFEICQKFVKYVFKTKCTQKELAGILEIDEAKVSKILNHRIDEFSTDRLISLYEKLNPSVKLAVS